MIRIVQRSNTSPISTPLLWVVFFLFACAMAVFLQMVLLPLLPSLHAGNGLLVSDSVLFHDRAVRMAEVIGGLGWSYWHLNPVGAGSGSGNVAILAILYHFFGPYPWLAIPINAALHASSGVLLFLLAQKLWPTATGRWAGLFASVLFVVMPSALNWYGQLLKDGYAILAYFLFGYALILVFSPEAESSRRSKNFATSFFAAIVAALLLALVRPQNLQIMAVTGALSLGALLLLRPFGIRLNRLAIPYVTCLSLFLLFAHNTYQIGESCDPALTSPFETAFSVPAAQGWLCAKDNPAANSTTRVYANVDWTWKPNSRIPAFMDELARQLSLYRSAFLNDQIRYADSTIDRDIAPDSFYGFLAYSPHAIAKALFAPFPNTWFDKLSLFRLFGTLEIAFLYVAYAGIIFLPRHTNLPAVVTIVVFSAVFLFIYGYVVSNIGTLHRSRFPFSMLLMLLGVGGYAHLVERKFSTKFVPNSLATSPSSHFREDVV